jgi:hypothetical protein
MDVQKLNTIMSPALDVGFATTNDLMPAHPLPASKRKSARSQSSFGWRAANAIMKPLLPQLT